MSDPVMIFAGATGVAAVVCGLGWAYAASAIRSYHLSESADLDTIRTLTDKLVRAERRLGENEAKEAARRDHLRKAGKAGRAAQIAKASETKADRERLANMATAKTMAELSRTQMPPRDKVVAGVHAKRAAKKAAATA